MSTGLVRTAHTRRRRALLLSLCALAATGMGGAQARQRQPIGERNVAVRPAVSELPAPAKRYALIVGVDTYADAQIGALGGAANDARLLASTLVERAGFPAEQVVLLASGEPPERQPTRGQILRRLSNLVGVVPRDGLLLFSFAGHGVERGGRAFLLPSDAQLNGDVELLEQTAVEATWVRKRIEAAGVRQVLMLLDACRNDPAAGRSGGGSVLTETYRRAFNFELRNRNVEAFATIYATAVGGRAYEYKEKGHGYFTWVLVEGLRGGAADARGEVTLAGLVKYVQEHVPRRVALDLGPGLDQRPFVDISGYRADELVVAVARDTAGTTPLAPRPLTDATTSAGTSKGPGAGVGGVFPAQRPPGPQVAAPGPKTTSAGRKAGEVLLITGAASLKVGAASVTLPDDPPGDPFWNALSDKVIKGGQSTTIIIFGQDAAGWARRLTRGDRGVLRLLNYAVIVVKEVGFKQLNPYEGIQIVEASLTLKAFDGYTGETLAQENIVAVRGFGNTQQEAIDQAYKTAGEKISEQFIKRVRAAAVR